MPDIVICAFACRNDKDLLQNRLKIIAHHGGGDDSDFSLDPLLRSFQHRLKNVSRSEDLRTEFKLFGAYFCEEGSHWLDHILKTEIDGFMFLEGFHTDCPTCRRIVGRVNEYAKLRDTEVDVVRCGEHAVAEYFVDDEIRFHYIPSKNKSLSSSPHLEKDLQDCRWIVEYRLSEIKQSKQRQAAVGSEGAEARRGILG